MTLFHERPELPAASRRGERHALELVYWAYVDRIEALVRRASNGQREDVEDLVQEAFARAFAERARLGFDGLREYGPYLAILARNLVVDWARRRGRELPIDALSLEPASGDGDSEPAWAAPATMAVVESYVASLAPELRAVHEQRFVLARSQAAAAPALGLTRQQLRTLEKRLRQGLARALRQAGL